MKPFFVFFMAIMTCLSAIAQNEPVVTTSTSFARGADQAFGRATFKSVNGNTITERGFCWSSISTEPTLSDSYSTDYISNQGTIFWMKNLQPATIYYARAYAVGKDGSVGYGNVIKIVTLPSGNIGWGYDNGGNAAENARINSAVAECVDYWNSLTNITGLYLNVHYGAQTPTADCSYGGWMRVGPNASYQKTGTIMHEALHAIGVGQHDMWYGASSPLRAGSGTGQWLGDRATQVLRFWDNNPSAVLTGDNTHMWPYGINGAHEDNGSPALYIGTSLLAQALGEDGLPCTNQRAFASPYYSFCQEDTIKYYIKNESESYGLRTSFLIETVDNKLEWQELTPDQAANSDAAAWYVTFTPDNQYYQFRNASTGNYITYVSSGVNGIRTIARQTPAANENFHLMPSRKDVMSAEGEVVCQHRALWIIHPENTNPNPGTLTASGNGQTMVTSLNLSDASARQRWLILTAQQAYDMENSALVAAHIAFDHMRMDVMSLIETPHIEIVSGAKSELLSSVDAYVARSTESSSAGEILALTDSLLAAGKTFLSGVCASSLDNPFDLTFLISNPDFTTGKSGWGGTVPTNAVWGYQAIEFYEKTVNAIQTLPAMPAGTYEVTVQAFQRPGSYTNVYTDYISGTDNSGAVLYLINRDVSTKVKNIMADRSRSSLHSEDKKLSDGSYIPNTMASASAHFEAGAYLNTHQRQLPELGDLKFGITATNNNNTGYWTIMTNFHLYYYGPGSIEELNDILGIAQHPLETAVEAVGHVFYDLIGRRIESNFETAPTGMYVSNGRIVIVK